MLIYEVKLKTGGCYFEGKMQGFKNQELTCHIDADSLEHAMEIMNKRYQHPTFLSVKLLFVFTTEEEWEY